MSTISQIDQDYKKSVNEKYNVRPFVHVKPTTEKIDYVHLSPIDLSTYKDGAEGYESRKALADELEKDLKTYGFFALVGHGVKKELLDKLHAIGQSVMELPEDEKEKYYAGGKTTDTEDKTKTEGGERGNGYKPRGYWSLQNGVRDQIEHFNLDKLLQPNLIKDVNNPELIKANLDDIVEYYSYLHNEVLRKITILCDIILEIPEGTLWENYFKVRIDDVEHSGFGLGRLMMYYGMKESDEKKTANTWLRGHSDSTAFTFIYSQAMTSLQIRDYYTGAWKYISYLPDSFVCNVGDSMEFLTGAYFKSTIHRVVKPPKDQQHHKRLGVIYFSHIAPSTVVDPETINSPKLQRLGYVKPKSWEKITFAQWYNEKDRFFGNSKLYSGPTEEPIPVLIYGRLNERWHQVDNERNKTLLVNN